MRSHIYALFVVSVLLALGFVMGFMASLAVPPISPPSSRGVLRTQPDVVLIRSVVPITSPQWMAPSPAPAQTVCGNVVTPADVLNQPPKD